MTLVPVATSVQRADDLLPLARRLLDRAGDAVLDDPEIAVSCRAGCSACCSQAVPVTRAEVRGIRLAITRLPDVQQQVIAERILATDAALAAAGIGESAFIATGDDSAARTAAAMAYFALDLPCPLLEDGVCSIRADRPLACREYLVTSDPAFCADPIVTGVEGRPGGLGTVVRIRPRTNALTGFQQVSAVFGEDRASVLAFALARPPADPPLTAPQSGPRLAQLLV